MTLKNHIDQNETRKAYAEALLAAHHENDQVKKLDRVAHAKAINGLIGSESLETDLSHTRRIVQAVEVLRGDKKNAAAKRAAEAEEAYAEHLLQRIREGVQYVANGSVRGLESAAVAIEALLQSNERALLDKGLDAKTYFKKIAQNTAEIRGKYAQAMEDAKRVGHANETLARAEAHKTHTFIKKLAEKGK